MDNPWFNARYPTWCGNCGLRIQPGDRIRRSEEGEGYECCEPDPKYMNGDGDASRRLNETICDRCHLVKPCFCV